MAWTQWHLKVGTNVHATLLLCLTHSPGFVWMHQSWSKGVSNPQPGTTAHCPRQAQVLYTAHQPKRPYHHNHPHHLISSPPPDTILTTWYHLHHHSCQGWRLMRPQPHHAAGHKTTVFYQKTWINPFSPRALDFWNKAIFQKQLYSLG